MSTAAGSPRLVETDDRYRSRLLEGLNINQVRRPVNGTETSILESGNGPALVLLHGGIECGGVYWAPIVHELATDYHVLMPDVPGLGESEPVARLDQPTFDTWFQSFLETHCPDGCILVAHSLLGTMAARFAAVHHRLLKELVIYAAPGVGRYRMPLGLKIVAIRFSIRPSRRNAERFERWAFVDYDQVVARNPSWMESFSEYSRSRARIPHVKRTMRQLIGDCTKEIPQDTLRQIPVPVALLWGQQDRFVPISLAENTAAKLGWPLQVMPEVGHAAHIESPTAFVRALRAALASNSPAAAVLADT